MIKRTANSLLKELSKGYPIITITGPRQSGKTTLARSFFKKKPYVSLENIDTREMAQNDPRGFLSRYKNGAIFDEIQRCPQLFSYLQQIVDENKKNELFILTGSQQFGLLSGITQSLAGRVASLQLLPFSYQELYGNKNTPIELDNVLYKGLYPPIHDRMLRPYIWYENYVQTYIERDVRQLVNIKDLNMFQRFLRMCAARTGNLVNFSEIANSCGVSHNTVKSWISILEASYIIFLLHPYHKNFNKRIIKTPKLYFYDTGLASWLLSIQNESQLNTHPMRGNLFECFIISEMLKHRFNKGMAKNIYFWRDRSGNEVDVLLDEGGHLIPIEIKSSQTMHDSFIKNLKKLETITGQPNKNPALVYGGNDMFKYKEIQVVPWRKAVNRLLRN